MRSARAVNVPTKNTPNKAFSNLPFTTYTLGHRLAGMLTPLAPMYIVLPHRTRVKVIPLFYRYFWSFCGLLGFMGSCQFVR